MNSMKRAVRLPCLILAGIGILYTACTAQVGATTYGQNAYGSCQYQTCPTTVVTLPGNPGGGPGTSSQPIEVDINLTDGQEIPHDGYRIVVTPLTGSGTTIQDVTFTVNGQLVTTQTPAGDGSVQWSWSPSGSGDTDVSIEITGNGGQTVTKTFHVVIMPAAVKPATSVVASAPPTGLSALIRAIERAIRTLPPLIKHAFPYFLFAPLLLDVLLLVRQLRRELTELQKLQSLITREGEISELKKSFMQLISHYIRTPIAILQGGIDMLTAGSVQATTTTAIRTDLGTLNARTDQLLDQSRQRVDTTAGAMEQDRLAARIVIWRQPAVVLPVVLIGLVAFGFDNLAQQAGSYTLYNAEIATQLIVYSCLAVLMYVVARRVALRRRAVVVMSKVLDDEVSLNDATDKFLHEAGQDLNKTLVTLDEHLGMVAGTVSNKFIAEGQTKLHQVVSRFVVADRLKGLRASSPFQSVNMAAICNPLFQSLSAKATAKGITMQLVGNPDFYTQNPELLSIVIRTVLDNAIDYSPEKSDVKVEAALTNPQQPSEITISITDHGQGIADDKRFALFRPFARADGVEVFNHEGMGFSLYLDQIIVKYLYGNIKIDAVKPHGTLVTLKLPQTANLMNS